MCVATLITAQKHALNTSNLTEIEHIKQDFCSIYTFLNVIDPAPEHKKGKRKEIRLHFNCCL